jgi:hypothetical protein
MARKNYIARADLVGGLVVIGFQCSLSRILISIHYIPVVTHSEIA